MSPQRAGKSRETADPWWHGAQMLDMCLLLLHPAGFERHKANACKDLCWGTETAA